MYDLLREVEIAGRIAALPKILDVACRSTGLEFAVLARVTEDRWIACGVLDKLGLGIDPGGELDVTTTICHHVLHYQRSIIVNDIDENDLYCDHPARRKYGFRSFISVPVVLPDGRFFGTLSALHVEPRILDSVEMIRSFELFAELISLNLDKELQLAKSRDALVEERRSSDLREQFIAVLGHDLRNPLASIRTASFVLRRQPDNAGEIVSLIDQSVARMGGLIDDVLDFARGRLGGGLDIKLEPGAQLLPMVAHVVDELLGAQPGRAIEVELDLRTPVDCDRGRIGQLLSNLLANALTHGALHSAVMLRGGVDDGVLELSVTNQGNPIPKSAMEMLFQPFVRASADANQKGLGLGLFIASQIAREHGGTLTVRSCVQETRFTFRMPAKQPARHAIAVHSVSNESLRLPGPRPAEAVGSGFVG